jgi:hypothetical protein
MDAFEKLLSTDVSLRGRSLPNAFEGSSFSKVSIAETGCELAWSWSFFSHAG